MKKIFFAIFLMLGCALKKEEQISKEYILKQENLIGQCQNFPEKKTLNWQYLENIDLKDLSVNVTEKILEKGNNEIILQQKSYKKIKFKLDNDSFIRGSNFIIAEILREALKGVHEDKELEEFLTLNPRGGRYYYMHGQSFAELKKLRIAKSPHKHFNNLKETLMELWPYRKKSLGEPGYDRIIELFEHLANTKDIDTLLTKLNHPCIDMTLSWLIRDLSWAFYNRFFKLSLKSLNDKAVNISSKNFKEKTDDIINNQNLPNDSIILHLAKRAKKYYMNRNGQKEVLKHKEANNDFDKKFAIISVLEEMLHDDRKIYLLKLTEAKKPNPTFLITFGGLIDDNFTKINGESIYTDMFLEENEHSYYNVLIAK